MHACRRERIKRLFRTHIKINSRLNCFKWQEAGRQTDRQAWDFNRSEGRLGGTGKEGCRGKNQGADDSVAPPPPPRRLLLLLLLLVWFGL